MYTYYWKRLYSFHSPSYTSFRTKSVFTHNAKDRHSYTFNAPSKRSTIPTQAEDIFSYSIKSWQTSHDTFTNNICLKHTWRNFQPPQHMYTTFHNPPPNTHTFTWHFKPSPSNLHTTFDELSRTYLRSLHRKTESSSISDCCFL